MYKRRQPARGRGATRQNAQATRWATSVQRSFGVGLTAPSLSLALCSEQREKAEALRLHVLAVLDVAFGLEAKLRTQTHVKSKAVTSAA